MNLPTEPQPNQQHMKTTQTRNTLIKSLLLVTALVPTCCEAQTKPSGIVAWWKAEGNMTEEIQGLQSIESVTSYAPGVVGQAFSEGFHVHDMSPALRVQDFTIEAWIKRDSNRATPPPVSGNLNLAYTGAIFGYGDGGYSLRVRDDGALVLHQNALSGPFNPFVGVVSPSGLVRNDGKFHHVAVTKSGDEVIFYVDGIQRDSQTFSTTFTFSTPIGIKLGGDDYSLFIGKIDELAVYARALSAQEVQDLIPPATVGNGVLVGLPEFVSYGYRMIYNGLTPYSSYATTVLPGTFAFTTGDHYTGQPKISNNGDGPSVYGAGSRIQEYYSDWAAIHNFSVVGWVRRVDDAASTDPEGGSIVSWGANGWGLFVTDDGSVKLSKIGANSVSTQAGLVPNNGIYHHVAVTKTNDSVVFYVNGVSVTNLTFSETFDFSTAGQLGIGTRWDEQNNSYNTINADLDEIIIFDQALTPQEVKAIWDDQKRFDAMGFPIVIVPETLVDGPIQILSALPLQSLKFEVTNGALPPGLSLSDDGIISGTATGPSPYGFVEIECGQPRPWPEGTLGFYTRKIFPNP